MPHLPEQVGQAILAHASTCAPDECCGLIAVDGEGRIVFAYPLTNANPSPVTFTIDPEEHFHAIRHAESRGWEIGGAFHSHPAGPASPSMLDVQGALDPEWMYLIAAGDEVRGYRIMEGRVEEIRFDPVSPIR